MKTIEADATVASGGRLLLELPSDIAPGKRRVVLVLVGDWLAIEAEKP